MCFESVSIKTVSRDKISIYKQGDKQWKLCGNASGFVLMQVTMWQIQQRLLSTQSWKPEIPSRATFINWQLWTGQFYFICPLFTVNVWKIHLVLFVCMHEIWKETKTCLSKNQEHDKNTVLVRTHSHSSNRLCSLCLTQMFANTIEVPLFTPSLTSDKPEYCSVIVQDNIVAWIE